MPLSDAESEYIEAKLEHLAKLRDFLSDRDLPSSPCSPREMFSYFSDVVMILGNFNNAVSFIATILARNYLVEHLSVEWFDVAGKAMGAKGLDIDVSTANGKRVIGEIKTTVPYKGNDLGAKQKDSFRIDFRKLNRGDADHRFFFLTSDRAFDLMKRKYASEIPGVTVVLLTTGEEYQYEEP